MSKQLDFSKQKGNYSNNLDNGRDQINNWYSDSTVSVADFKLNIEKLIESAYINVTAKPRFLHNLRSQRTKDGILFLCYNSIMSAQGYGVG